MRFIRTPRRWRQQAGEGVEIALRTEHLGGFTRVPNHD